MASVVPEFQRAARAFDPATWKNSYYPFYIVQALRRDPKALHLDGVSDATSVTEMFSSGPCNRGWSTARWLPLGSFVKAADGRDIAVEELRYRSRFLDAEGQVLQVEGVEQQGDKMHVLVAPRHCPGVGAGASSWVPLARGDALHAIYKHYTYPNLSICRFASHARVDYSADLIFEIDVHDEIPAGSTFDWFRPFIGAAVEAGRLIFDYLVEALEVCRRYMTVEVTRMGARVTVDWRAFGPRRLHQLLGVLRHIEHQVFGVDGLKNIAARHGVKQVEIDGHIYAQSDAPRPSDEDGNKFKGPWLRPPGALHTKSSDRTFWYRTTPVSHEEFTPGQVDHLIRVSRGVRGIMYPRDILRWPEARYPGVDWLIEANPEPAEKLIRMFNDESLVEGLPPAYRAEVIEASRKTSAERVQGRAARGLDEQAVEVFLKESGAEFQIIEPGKIVFPCVRSECLGKDGEKAAILGGAVYACFRCTQGMSLPAVAEELGIKLPRNAQSSSPLTWMNEQDAPALVRVQDDWGYGTKLVRETLPTVQDVWERRTRELSSFLDDPSAKVLVDISEPGLGKSETSRMELKKRGEPVRVFVSRDDNKTEYQAGLPGAVNIRGRRLNENCSNPAAKYSMNRFEPVGQSVCSTCPDRHSCGYRAQFRGIDGRPLLLSHGHLAFAEFDLFDNGSNLDVIDEDALKPRYADLTARERHNFVSMTTWVIEMPEPLGYDAPWGDTDMDFGFDKESGVMVRETRSAATPNLQSFFSQLERRLSGDAVFEAGIVGNEMSDVILARHLFRDDAFREAFDALADEDFEEHEDRRRSLVLRGVGARRRDGQTEHLGVINTPDDSEWETSPERTEALRLEAAGNDFAELGAYVEWSSARSKPLVVRVRSEGDRPLNVLPALVEELRLFRLFYTVPTERVSRLMAVRDENGWTLRLWLDNKHKAEDRKVILLSATMTPARAHLLLGPPGLDGGWTVLDLRVARPEHRIQVADSFFGKTSLLSSKKPDLRQRVFETVRVLVVREHERTGLPVGVFGSGEVMNMLVAEVLGKPLPNHLAMPIEGDRAEKLKELNAMLEPHHMMVGYSFGVAGSNDYHVVQDGVRRFIRSVVVIGSPLPELAGFGRAHRGLLTDYLRLYEEEHWHFGPWVNGRNPRPSWAFGWRSSRIAGPATEGRVPVVANDFGFTDPIADEILYGAAHAEVLQLAGRMRPHLVDPIDPSIQPRVYYLGGLVVPAWEVDEVLTLDSLREQLGLWGSKRKAGRPLTKTLKQHIEKHGRRVTLKKLADMALKAGNAPSEVLPVIENVFQTGNVDFTEADREEVRRHVGQCATPKSL